jgi:hypothetical protein
VTDEPRARLEAEHRREKAAVRRDPGLSWEHKERRIKALGDEHRARLKELRREEGAA